MITESVVALVRYLLLADQFLFRPRQFFRSKAVICEFVDLIKQRGFHWLDLLRVGAEVECKESRNQALHLAGADVIGQSHLLTNANKEPRSEIAARLINQFQCVAIWTRQTGAAKSYHDHPLGFVLAAFDSFRFAQ